MPDQHPSSRGTLGALAAALLLAAALAAPAQDGATQDPVTEALTPYVMPKSGPFRPDEITIRNNDFIARWATSPHADAQSEAFVHWDADGAIPVACAACHSGAGFRDFHGLDGSPPGIEAPVPTGGVVDCATCHNPELAKVTEVTLPSGVTHPVTPVEATCMTCHMGRESGLDVAAATGDGPDDTVDAELSFINPHYRVAAAIWMGASAKGGYEYPGKSYSGQFFHARPIETCASCHDPHTLRISAEVCATCHVNGTPDAIRLARVSYDGSGDLTKGIRADLAANAALLGRMIVDYSAAVAGARVVHEDRYPYFFADADADGRADMVEGRPQRYAAWTPRMLRAAYNWKLVTADPGAFVHNPHYALELLHDSIEDLAGALGRDMAALGLYR